jgi:protoheme IX farnesyltransferase
MMSLYALTLIPASFAPVLLGVAGPLYLAGALALGAWFWLAALGFRRRPSLVQARRVLRVSLIYLPGLLALLLLDHLSGARVLGM